MRQLITLLSFITIVTGYGQLLPKQFQFEHAPIPGAIRSSEAVDIIQDPDGLIWIAGDGLFRYDGYTFTRYINLADSGTISGKQINSLFYDVVKKRLLIATRNFGVVEYSYETNSLRRLPVRDGVPIINSLTQTSNGEIWATSFSSGIFYIENDTLKKHYSISEQIRNATSLYALDDKLLIGDVPKIYFIKNEQITDSLLLNWPDAPFSAYGRVTAMVYDKKSKLYIGTEKLGVLIYDLEQNKFIKYFRPDASPFYNRINRLFVDRDGLVWILTKAGGVAVYNPAEDRHIVLTKNPFSQTSISDDNCTAIIQDMTGIIWVSGTGDLNKYDRDKIKFTHITHNPFDKNSLTDKMVRGIYEDENENLLIGTDGGYINIINQKSDQIDHIKVTVPDHDGIIIPTYFLNFDKNNLLIGTSAGLILMNKQTRRFSFFEPLREQFQGKMVRQILKKGNKIYFISASSLYIFNLNNRELKQFKNFTNQENQRAYNATNIFFDSRERLWVGVQGGISLLNPDDTFTLFPFEENSIRPDGSYFMVLSMEEINNQLWIGTFNTGLWIMDLPDEQKKTTIVQLTEQSGLINNTVYSTLPDEDGNIWISSNQGISKYEVEERRFIHFTVNEGLQDTEFNRLAYLKTKSKQLVFGGINGINIFDPSKVSISSSIYKPVILSAIENRNLENPKFLNLRNRAELKLSHSQNYITLEFLVPVFQQPARYEVNYKLENHDLHWTRAVNNQASYANLKPGRYRFVVSVKDYDQNEQTSSVIITIANPFWRTWWFVSLTLFVIAFLTYTIIQSYYKKNKRDKEQLENLLKERTAEIEKSRAQLENLNQKKDLIFSILSHDLRSPLTTLKGFLSLLIDNTDSLTKEDIRKYSTNIRNSVTSSLDLIDNTLFWSLSQTDNISYTPAFFFLNESIKKVIGLYQLTAEKKHIKFDIDVPDNIMIYADENMIFVTLRNLVSNAIKFSPEEKSVHIKASSNHNFAKLTITDEGVGMSSDYLQKLESEEHPALKRGTLNEKGTGLGLILCRKFILINKGELQITSAENQGTQFTVTIPMTDQV